MVIPALTLKKSLKKEMRGLKARAQMVVFKEQSLGGGGPIPSFPVGPFQFLMKAVTLK